MNSKGQVFFLTLMLGIVVLLLGLYLAFPLTQVTDTTQTGLDCSNNSISIYDRGTCIITDVTSPFFVAILIALGLAILGAKAVSG